jgi:vancomycin permeability regulator SanA
MKQKIIIVTQEYHLSRIILGEVIPVSGDGNVTNDK